MSMSEQVFPSWYSPDDRDRRLFGEQYAPPEKFEHGEWHKVAEYPKTTGDGQACEIYECRMPARFFKLVALDSANSIDKPRAGFALSTGSGDGVGTLMVSLAKAIADGMIGPERHEAPVGSQPVKEVK